MKPGIKMLELFGQPIYEVCRRVEGSLEMSTTGSDKVHEQDRDQVNVYKVFTNKSLDQVRHAVAMSFLDEQCECTCDCCGCWFRSSISTVSAYDRECTAYFIIETFSQNF
jgi:hypothetical protein